MIFIAPGASFATILIPPVAKDYLLEKTITATASAIITKKIFLSVA
jgi:hypothetical protein